MRGEFPEAVGVSVKSVHLFRNHIFLTFAYNPPVRAADRGEK